VRDLRVGLALELRAGDNPSLVLAQGDTRISLQLADVKSVVAVLTDAEADLAEVLAAGGVYHA
jgi:hypothetical protein